MITRRFKLSIVFIVVLSLILSHLDNSKYFYSNNNQPGESYEYTVEPHQSLSVIADDTRPKNVRFNTWLSEIELVNGMDSNTVIYPGELIKIPEAK